MEAMLGNPSQMAQMHDRESAGEYVGSSLGQGPTSPQPGQNNDSLP